MIDYEVVYAVERLTEDGPLQSPLNYIVYDAEVVGTSLVLLSRDAGKVYSIKVRARNLVGSGDYTAPVSILAAQVPDSPKNLRNNVVITNSAQIGLLWDAPDFDGGSKLIDYSIWYDEAIGSSTFVEL